MRLSKNSINARVYSFVYGNSLPTNLCPYFWKSLLALLLLPLVLVFQLFYYPLSPIKWFKEEISGDRFSERTMGVCFMIVILLLTGLGFFINDFFVDYVEGSFGFVMSLLGFACSVVIVGATFWIVGGKLENKLKNREKRPSLIKEYFKAKKGKYCPQIEWTEK